MVLLQVSQLFLLLDWIMLHKDLKLTRPLNSHHRHIWPTKRQTKPLFEDWSSTLFLLFRRKRISVKEMSDLCISSCKSLSETSQELLFSVTCSIHARWQKTQMSSQTGWCCTLHLILCEISAWSSMDTLSAASLDSCLKRTHSII